jgi:3-phenylpropionate/trans-cinnamate dioxygenase ferredoxin reductase component
MEQFEIVIVGGGLAGAAAAESYRAAGGAGAILLLSEESTLPIHRPPLSKEYLRGDAESDSVLVHPQEFYTSNTIDIRPATRVQAIDTVGKTVLLHGGVSIGFRTLVLATGARPRRLNIPGSTRTGVHELRTLASSLHLRNDYAEGKRVVVIGAGFIGMEVAASLAQKGADVTVVEVGPRMWSRIVPEQVALRIQAEFERRGVQLVFGTGVQEIEGRDRVSGVRLADGTVFPADLVVTGVGAVLNTELAEAAGLPVTQGVVVDEYFRTAHPDIFAIGDIANFPDAIGGRLHLEHWDNALHQGRALGKTLAGDPAPYDHVAYFFSDLFDLSVNLIGYPNGWDEVIVRGDPSSTRFTTIYLRDRSIVAVLMLNDDAHFDTWTELVKARCSVSGVTALLADPSADPGEALAVTPSA